MATLTTSDLLKYADLQMAAEAFLVDDETRRVKQDLVKALTDGNFRSSKFTLTQAKRFLEHWTVEDQKPNTPTGFSGTLFLCIKDDPSTGAKKGERVMSFRSTEFIDDAARDNQATNSMEIRQAGFAFGQIRDMEAWYAELKNEGGPLAAGQTFDVTGYSLGGHLATAFNMLRGPAGIALRRGAENTASDRMWFSAALWPRGMSANPNEVLEEIAT